MLIKRIKIHFLAFALSTCPLISSGQETSKPLTLDGCFGLAGKNNELLRIQQQKITQAQQRHIQAKGDILPNINLEYSTFFRDSATGLYSAEGTDSSIAFNQPLFYGLRKMDAISISRADIARENCLYRSALREIKTEVIQSFYAIIQAEKDIENINNALKVMQGRLQELNDRVNIGKSRESEILVVESQIATLLAQQQKTEGDREKTLEALSSIIGVELSGINLVDNTPDIADAGKVELYTEAVKQRPDIEVARQDIAVQSLRIKIAREALLPALDIDGSWYISRSGSMSDWDVYLSIDLPLFHGGILRSKIKEELSRKQELEEKASFLVRNATAEVKILHKALVSSLKQATAFKDAFDKSEKSYQLQLKDYKFGLVNNLDVIQAMTTMSDAKRNLDRALIQVKSDKAMLDIATIK